MELTKRELLLQAIRDARELYPEAALLPLEGPSFETLCEVSVHDVNLCEHVMDYCASALNAMEPEPEEGRMKRLCSKLRDNIYPDAAHPVRALSGAEQLYLQVLDVFFGYREPVFEPTTDLLTFDLSTVSESSVAEEYSHFRRAVQEFHILSLMRLTRETDVYNIAGHVTGVHNVALHMAILTRAAGFHVDLPLVSAAALGHDIGKFGCRGEEQRRVPYLHYYYTHEWFAANGMENIGYIAANHSTWDLEFENLPIESLLLIYADFCVRGYRVNGGREQIEICSLDDSYGKIMSKLADMTPEKTQRYQTVYSKLHDFEQMLRHAGVSPDFAVTALLPADRRDPALLDANEALQGLRIMALSGSVELMYTVGVDRTFSQLLEQAKSEKALHSIRTYLFLFREFCTYMSKANKKKLLVLLYDLLLHQDGDVRRTAGSIMGQILANSGPKYRKERPNSAQSNVITPAMAALLDESVELWQQYIELCLHPDRKNSPKHALRISNSLKTIAGSLFALCDEKDAPRMLRPLLEAFYRAEGSDRFALIDALCNIPVRYLALDSCSPIIDKLFETLHDPSEHLRLICLNCLQHLCKRPELQERIRPLLSTLDFSTADGSASLLYMQDRVLGRPTPPMSEEAVSALYLTNLKNAVHWTVKISQLGLLADDAFHSRASRFHTAMHFSNMLCVSEHLPVREAAGEHLLELAPMLSVDQINEISIDLLRELETGQEQITRFIPPYIGRLLCLLPEKELSEAVEYLADLVRGASARGARSALAALAQVIVCDRSESLALCSHVLGILMTGISHYDADVHETALRQLCGEVFGSPAIPLPRRGRLFCMVHKKLLALLSEPRTGRLTFFNRAAMMNHLYRFIVEYQVKLGSFPFAPQKPAAFFPGTFDPFSVGHKQIVECIRELGFEVYLAVDEFSWSKKTLPKLLRRQIVSISTADQWDTYLFPDEIPVNIAMPRDLANLNAILPGKELWLVAGSDVIRNASAYKSDKPGTAADYNHIIFSRQDAANEGKPEFSTIIRGKLQVLTLPAFYETVSSTRIREYVDRKLDISMLVDPVVQSFIYANGLYVRSPESKELLTRRDLSFATVTAPGPEIPEEMCAALEYVKAPLGVTLTAKHDTLFGWAVGTTLHTPELYEVLHSIDAAGYVRNHTSGRILLVSEARVLQGDRAEVVRMLLNELLVRSLRSDHTYALCRCPAEDTALAAALGQLGFVPIENCDDLYYVDMRSPVMLLQDVMLYIKQPHHDAPAVKKAVAETRPRLRTALGRMFPGKLLLTFDSEQLNQALVEKISSLNGVDSLPEGVRLGPNMCVPYGKILSDVIVPHTVTKTLHSEKRFHRDLKGFDIVEYPGYSPLRNQVRMLKSFERPVLLVDDLLHKGYRINKLDRSFRQEGLIPEKIVVAIMSGSGEDLLRVQNREVECEYFIPNLHYWVYESLLYPFIGGDSIEGRPVEEHMLPSINLILPYCYPSYFSDTDEKNVWNLSQVCLENTLELMQALEQAHQELFDTTLTLLRLGEALTEPRLPEQMGCMQYDFTLPASAYVQEDLLQLEHIRRRER